MEASPQMSFIFKIDFEPAEKIVKLIISVLGHWLTATDDTSV